MSERRAIEIGNNLIDYLLNKHPFESVLETLIIDIGIHPDELIRYYNFSETDVNEALSKINC